MVWNGEVRSLDLWMVVTFRDRMGAGIWILVELLDLLVDLGARVSWMTRRLLPWCDLSVLSVAVVSVGVFVLTYQAPSDAH